MHGCLVLGEAHRDRRGFFQIKVNFSMYRPRRHMSRVKTVSQLCAPVTLPLGKDAIVKDKGKVTVHAMKAYRDSRGTAPLILYFGPSESELSASRPGRFILGKYPRYPLNMRLGCLRANPDCSQTRAGSLGEEIKFLPLAGIRILDRVTHSLVSIPTTLSRETFGIP